MDKSFVFGVPVEGQYFIGRTEESKRLGNNFRSGVNTILLSPRRWGKTSLVMAVAESVNSKETIVVRMDAYSCRDEYDFYNAFSEAILKQTSSKIEEWKTLASGFIERLTPKIILSPDSVSEYSVSLGITPRTHSPEEILELPQKIAERKNCNIVVCIDEFQQIGEFYDSITAQKRMRSVWQHQKNVSYCLYGSKMHMMTALFQKKSNPFYKFGDLQYLQAIPLEEWTSYIIRRFALTGKSISGDIVKRLCETVEYQSSYVQQLAWCLNNNTESVASEEGLNASIQDLVDQNSPVFIQQTENLTSYQLNFLRAVLDGIHSDFGCKEIREEYNLGSPSNITRLKKSLIDKELVEINLDGIHIVDPILRIWLQKIL